MATLIDGKALAASLRESLTRKMKAFRDERGRAPGLGILLAGDNPASEVYVRNKLRIGEKVGAHTRLVRLPSDCTTTSVIESIRSLNNDPEIDAFLVQLPLPPNVDQAAALAEVDPMKDVDGLHEVKLRPIG